MGATKMKSLVTKYIPVVLLLTLGACATPQVTTIPPITQYVPDDPRAELVLASRGLFNIVSMENVTLAKSGPLTRARIDVRSLTLSRTLNLEYQVQWRDVDGFPVNSMSAWQRFTLQPEQIERIDSVGKVQEAEGFRLTIREFKNSIN